MKAPPRVYCPFPLHPGAHPELPEAAAHHLTRVLRLGPGAELRLFDGVGDEWQATITHVDKRGVRAALQQKIASERESPLAITLLQGIAGADKMDWIIQKAVELGVQRIVPLATERAVLKLDAERAAKRLRHWQNVVISACEQCGRNHLPELQAPLPLPQRLAQASTATRILLSPNAQHTLPGLGGAVTTVELLIGPEGGLSERELQTAAAAGFCAVHLGPRVLRTETAGLAAIAAMQVLWGDWR